MSPSSLFTYLVFIFTAVRPISIPKRLHVFTHSAVVVFPLLFVSPPRPEWQGCQTCRVPSSYSPAARPLLLLLLLKHCFISGDWHPHNHTRLNRCLLPSQTCGSEMAVLPITKLSEFSPWQGVVDNNEIIIRLCPWWTSSSQVGSNLSVTAAREEGYCFWCNGVNTALLSPWIWNVGCYESR